PGGRRRGCRSASCSTTSARGGARGGSSPPRPPRGGAGRASSPRCPPPSPGGGTPPTPPKASSPPPPPAPPAGGGPPPENAGACLGPAPDPTGWRDVSVVVAGPAARDLDALFWSDWSFAPREPPRAADGPTPPDAATDPERGIPVQVVASGPDVEGDPLYESLIALLFAARERIWVATPYFVPDEILARALELTARR